MGTPYHWEPPHIIKKIHMCDMTHIRMYVCTCSKTRSHVWHDSFVRADMTPSSLRRVSRINVTWLVYVWVYVCMYINMYLCIYVCRCVYKHMYVCFFFFLHVSACVSHAWIWHGSYLYVNIQSRSYIYRLIHIWNSWLIRI
jgi:hypothetical protein